MREILEHLLGTKFMTGADRDQLLSDDLQYSLYLTPLPFNCKVTVLNKRPGV